MGNKIQISSSKPIIFHRFFSQDWKYGLFVLEDELGYTYCQATSPIYLTRMLLKSFSRQSNPKEAFTEFLLRVLSQLGMKFDGEVVSVPRLGEWACSLEVEKKKWRVKWQNGKGGIFTEITSKSITSNIKNTHKNLRWGKNGFLIAEEKWGFAEQLREGCPEEEEIENIFITEDVSAIKLAIELWLLRQDITKVPTKEDVTLNKCVKGLQSGLKGEVEVTFDFNGLGQSKVTNGVTLSGSMYKAKDGTVFHCSNEEEMSFFASIHGEIKPFSKDDYLKEAASWLGLKDKEELLRLKPKWTLLEKYEKLSSSQRAAVYSLPSKAWEALESDFWVSEWKKEVSFVNRLLKEGKDVPLTVNENLLNMICDYWKSKLRVDLATSEKFMHTKRDNLIKRVPFWDVKDCPMGFAFSSPCIFALVWSELLWCAAQNIEVQRCEFCQEYFVSKKTSRFCSKQCNEGYLSTEETIRSTLKSLHQDLTRMAEKLETGQIKMGDYLKKWKEWETLKLEAKTKRQAKKIHPGIVFLRTKEGKKKAEEIKLALREKDKYAVDTTWDDYLNLIKKRGIPQPPKEWVIDFLKNSPA